MKKRILFGAVCWAALWLYACGGGGGDGTEASPQPASSTTPQVMLVDAFPKLTFDQPVALLQNPVDAQRWYVVERGGRVRTFAGADADTASVFLDLSGSVATQGEGGLLNMAFDPEFSNNGRIYVDYTRPGSGAAVLTTHISRFVTTGGVTVIDPAGEEVLLSVAQPYDNHNGGWIAFGPVDGLLYIGLGDGGSAGDPHGNGQDTHTLLGAILRIDVSGSGSGYTTAYDNPFYESAEGRPEIFAWGFRNPWRGSFDAQSGDLWIGDVGQDKWEEVDLVAVGGNYGWNIMEGDHCYPPSVTDCDRSGLTPPIAEYAHDVGEAMTGGYVYRGTAIAGLAGDFIYGDFESGRIWRLVNAAGGGTESRLLLDSGLQVVSFGQDGEGEIYVIDFVGGHIYRMAPESGR